MTARNSAVELFVSTIADPSDENIRSLKEHRSWKEHLQTLTDEDVRLLANMLDRFLVLTRLQPLQTMAQVAEMAPGDTRVLNELAGRIKAQRTC